MSEYSLNDLTKGKMTIQILLFSLPLILSNLLQVLFNLADVAVVGKFAGSTALGAVGSTTTLVAMFTSAVIGLAAAVNVLVARYIGTKDKQSIKEIVHSSFIVCLSIGIFFLVFGQFGSHWVLSLLNTKDELIDLATTYLKIYFLGMPFLALYNFGNAVFSASGDTKKPVIFLSIAGIFNIIGNLFFVIVLKMSVSGVAFASVISQFISCVLIIIALIRNKEAIHLSFEFKYVTWIKIRQIISLGIPALIQNMIFQLANLFVQKGVNTFDAITVEGNSAAMNADNLVYDVMAAFYTACGSFIGQNYGAGNKKRMKQAYLISLGYAAIIALVMGFSLAAFSNTFLSLFTNDMNVVVAGRPRLIVMSLSYWISAFMDNTIAASRALGYSTIPTVVVILGSCVFRILWIETIFAHYKTMMSLYLLYCCSWTITAALETFYFIHVFKYTTREL